MICAPTIFIASTLRVQNPDASLAACRQGAYDLSLFAIHRFAPSDYIGSLDISVSNACIAKGAQALAR